MLVRLTDVMVWVWGLASLHVSCCLLVSGVCCVVGLFFLLCYCCVDLSLIVGVSLTCLGLLFRYFCWCVVIGLFCGFILVVGGD